MEVKIMSQSWWDQIKDEGFVSFFGKLLFMILIYGLFFVLILEKEGGGLHWIFVKFPFLEVARSVSPAGLYVFWLLSIWIGFKFGKQVGMTRGAARERNRIGIPF